MHQIGIKVAPGADVQIAVTPKIIDIDQSALHFQPINRECYLEEEFGFNYLPDYDFRYRMSNCLFEALIEQTIRQCECSPSACRLPPSPKESIRRGCGWCWSPG